jgi:hypothetical protein
MMASQTGLFGTVGAAALADMQSGDIWDRAVLLSLSISSVGVKRKVRSSEVETDADRGMIHVSKDILQCDVLDDIRKHDQETRSWIGARALPSMFRAGVYLWPIALVADSDAYLQGRAESRAALVGRFCDAYLMAKADAERRLGSLYNPTDYLAVDVVRGKFSLSYQYIEISAPGRLRDILPEIFERERDKAAAQWANAIEEARDMLRGQLAGLVEHMAERMKPGEDGKPKRFKASMVEGFQEFLGLFQARNIADDSELAAVVERCRALMSGVSADAIRSSDELRDRLAAGMDEIRGSMDGLIVSQGRRIDLGPADAAPDGDGFDFGDI